VVAIVVPWVWFSPKHTDVGYQPVQPIPYSHKLHAGDLGIDCRYCHFFAERSPYAGVPPTQTCLSCHTQVRTESDKLAMVRGTGDALGGAGVNAGTGIVGDAPSIPWTRVHRLPDFVYFDHSVHLAASVGCVQCHGRIDQMVVVRQVQPLSMSWCFDCHRAIRRFSEADGKPSEAQTWDFAGDPATILRPVDRVPVTDMTWGPDHAAFAGWASHARTRASRLLPPVIECSGCHR
jgi:hypothetical protein